MTQLLADPRGDRRRRRAGVVERQARRDDRHAADDRALQRHGRRRGGGDRGRRAVRCRWRSRAARSASSASPPSSLAVVGGIIGAVSFSGSAIAFGKLQGLIKRSFRFSGQQFVNLLILVGALVLGGLVALAVQRLADHRHGVLRARAAARRHDDAADRRRGHAGRDLALQRAHRSRGRVRRLRAQQRRDDHRGHGGRLRRHAAHAADGEGDEPLARQRAVLRLRRDAAARPPVQSPAR